MNGRILLLVLAALLVAAPLAVGHGAPRPPDAFTRLLADHNDDCGGDDSGALSNCRGTHDIIALDVREAYDGTLGDIVVFRLLLNGGDAAAGLKDVISFNAGGARKSFDLKTSDNTKFTGAFDKVSNAMSLHDGSRFAVEGTLKRSNLGDIGAKLSGFKVDAYKGTTTGDYMPGGYHGVLENPNPAQGSDPTNYEKPDYTLRGPGYLIQASQPGAVTAATGQAAIIEMNIANPLTDVAQTVTLTATVTGGAATGFHIGAEDPSGSAYPSTETFDLQKHGSGTIHAVVTSSTATSGSVTIVITTDQGGHQTVSVPYTITTGSQPTTSHPSPSPTESNKSPSAGILVASALVGCAAWARRRA